MLTRIPGLVSGGVVLLIVVIATLGQAQPDDERPGFRGANADVPMEGLARQENYEPQAGLQACQLVFCTTDLSKVLVYAGSETTPVHNARSVVMSVDRISAQPKATCKLYAGVFEPTDPETKTWIVTEVRLVDSDQFQKLVDANEQSLRDLLRQKPVASEKPEKQEQENPNPGQPKANTDDSVPLAPKPKSAQSE